jgi:hypothetical protein
MNRPSELIAADGASSFVSAEMNSDPCGTPAALYRRACRCRFSDHAATNFPVASIEIETPNPTFVARVSAPAGMPAES